MKILLAVPTTPTISRKEFVLDLSPYQSAVGALWDDVRPEQADYIIAPYHLRAQLTDPRARPPRRSICTGSADLSGVFRAAAVSAFHRNLTRHAELAAGVDQLRGAL